MSTPPEIAALLTMVASLEQRLTTQDGRLAALDERVRQLEQRAPTPAAAPPAAAPPATLEEARKREKEEILAALAETSWNRLEAARKLGMPRRTLYRRMQEYGIQEGDSRTGFTRREKARPKKSEARAARR